MSRPKTRGGSLPLFKLFWTSLKSHASTVFPLGKIRFNLVRDLIGVAFLLFQFSMVVYARFVPSRYFCWAPNDYMVDYNLQVLLDGHVLNARESFRRYRLPEGGYQAPVQHIIDIVRQYEQTYGKNDHARIVMRYRVNGREEKEWHWPAD